MRSSFDWLFVVALSLATTLLAASEPSPPGLAHFEKHVRPLLEAKCLKCHGEHKQEGELRLDSRASVLKGGENGPTVVAGDPKTSLLIEAVNYESLEMPPGGQLSQREIEHLTLWIADGAAWPGDANPLRDVSGSITEADRQWWAFQPLTMPPIPSAPDDDGSRNPIDRFVRHRLSQAGMHPAPRADEITLVRRLYFDLIGLPPTPPEIDAYLADHGPDAWDRLVDKLLADSRYGEHWARFWLDLVRYAESDGWKADGYRPHMWRYRDYVVGAFNEDKPYPRFVQEQLAGDEMAGDEMAGEEMPGDDPSALAAAGFLRLGIYEYNQRDARAHWNDIINEITDVTGDVFLGMGMACARCHDHKFDPLLQKDYFQLRAFFEPLLWRDIATVDTVTVSTDEQNAARQRQQTAWNEATQDVRAQLDKLSEPYQKQVRETVVGKFPLEIQACIAKPPAARTSWDHQMAYLMQRQVADEGGGPRKVMPKEVQAEYDRLKQELAEFDDLKPRPSPVVMTVADAPGEMSPTVIPQGTSGTAVEPGFLSVLADQPMSVEIGVVPREESSGRRSALAAWIGRADNPLTTRVIVNRIWQQHFGKGIVATTNDFGHLGQPPTHPELLDWLTATFVERGWSMKDLHRKILTSATWQQSAHHPQAISHQQRDPAGDLLWRAPVRRLKAEQIRDAMLRATGELEPAVGGPSVDSPSRRRSLYVKVYRNTPDEFLHAFDMANALKSVAARIPTTTPTQSLLMINGGYALARAQVLSTRLAESEPDTSAGLLRQAFRRTWGRLPSESELAEACEFLGTTTGQDAASVDRQRLADFCHVLLNANPFLYVD